MLLTAADRQKRLPREPADGFCFPLSTVSAQGSLLYKQEVKGLLPSNGGWKAGVPAVPLLGLTPRTWGRPYSAPRVPGPGPPRPRRPLGVVLCVHPNGWSQWLSFSAVPDPLWREKGDRLRFWQQVNNVASETHYPQGQKGSQRFTSFYILPLQPSGAVITLPSLSLDIRLRDELLGQRITAWFRKPANQKMLGLCLQRTVLPELAFRLLL